MGRGRGFAHTLDTLQDVAGRTDGCATTGEPDKNDWIIDPGAQDLVYPAVLGMIGRIKDLAGK